MKSLYFVLNIVVLAALFFSSCADNSLKDARGKVVRFDKTVMVVSVDESEYTLNIQDARFSRDVALAGDSVSIHYLGDLSDNARAMLISRIPTASKVVEVGYDASKELLTAEPDSTDIQN